MFNEYSEQVSEIIGYLEIFCMGTETRFGVKFKEPHHDIARRFLNEIVEFEPMEKPKSSSLKSWE